MKIGIIGSGIVGKTLAIGFSKEGHEVMIGTRDPQKMETWKGEQANPIMVGTFTDCADFGALIVLAVKGSVAKDALGLCGNKLDGKTVIDTTNPIDSSRPPVNGVIHYFTKLDRSLMEELQAGFPDAHFVKAFNSIGNAHMVHPKFESKPTMFICGNSLKAKTEVTSLLTQIGWETCDMGAVEAARAIEPLCILWCIPGFLRNEWSHGFKLVR